MARPLSEELRTFFINMYHLKFKSLLVIIVALIILPFFFRKKIQLGLTKDFNNSFRYLMVYLINMYHLILLYNTKIFELDNFINEDLINGYDEGIRQRPIDILRRFIDQAGINLDGLVDIEIIQIEPDGGIRGIPIPHQHQQGQGQQGQGQGQQQLLHNQPIVINPADTQNVHDTSVQSHINIAINALKKCKTGVVISDNILVQSIRHHILNESKCFDDIKDKALTALKKIKKHNGILTRLNISEMEILHLVWNRINADCNKEVSNTLKENLTMELGDSVVDDDNMHCVQGRITRVMQCLQHADAEGILNIKPLWVIKEEISTIFGRYRDSLYSKLSPNKKAIYDKINPSPDESIMIEKINAKLRDHLNNYLTKKYVNTEIINLHQYETLTKDYFSALH